MRVEDAVAILASSARDVAHLGRVIEVVAEADQGQALHHAMTRLALTVRRAYAAYAIVHQGEASP